MGSISRCLLFATCAVFVAAVGCKSGDDDSGGTGGSSNVGTGGIGAGSGGMSGGTGGMAGGGAGSTVTGEPKFSAIFQEIMVGKGCNGGPLCHGGTAGGKLPMLKKDDTYAALVGVDAMGTNLPPAPMDCKDSGLKRVVAGDPDHSLLMLKVEAMQPCGMQMPPGGTSMLGAAEIAQIRMWIQNGAMND